MWGPTPPNLGPYVPNSVKSEIKWLLFGWKQLSKPNSTTFSTAQKPFSKPNQAHNGHVRPAIGRNRPAIGLLACIWWPMGLWPKAYIPMWKGHFQWKRSVFTVFSLKNGNKMVCFDEKLLTFSDIKPKTVNFLASGNEKLLTFHCKEWKLLTFIFIVFHSNQPTTQTHVAGGHLAVAGGQCSKAKASGRYGRRPLGLLSKPFVVQYGHCVVASHKPPCGPHSGPNGCIWPKGLAVAYGPWPLIRHGWPPSLRPNGHCTPTVCGMQSMHCTE